MPLYEYQCETCGHRFEAIQKFSDPPLEQCPKCSGPIRKLQSAPAFQFKGSGWYITDYAKKDSAPAATTGEKASGTKDTANPAAGEKSSSSDAAPAAAPVTSKETS